MHVKSKGQEYHFSSDIDTLETVYFDITNLVLDVLTWGSLS